MSNEIHNSIDNLVNTDPQQRANRFSKSAVLRIGSSVLQAWGAISGNQPALLIEAAEEMTDAMTFGAAAIEANSDRKGVVAKARKWAIGFAVTASTIASGELINDVVTDKFSFTKASEGLDFSHNDIKAAAGAIALNGIVLLVNRKGRQSKKTSDRFAFRDSIRDFVIPSSVLGIAAVQAPHWAEYMFELGGISYGWYNTKQLYNGWKAK